MQAEVNGNTVNYEVSGVEDGVTVMLSHSLGSSFSMWDPQLAALEANYRVVRYDTRGHGGSGAPEDAYGLDQLADDAAGLMDALGLEKVHWMGLSMGGMIGQNLGLRHASRLHSLCLCDTSSRIPAEAQPLWRERIETVQNEGMGALVDGTMERWFTAPYLARNPDELSMIREIFLATPPAGFIGCCHAISALDYTDQLGQIDKPTLVIVGEQDQGTPVAASEVIAAGIPGAKLVVLPEAAHLSNIEQAEAFTSAALNFLGGLDS